MPRALCRRTGLLLALLASPGRCGSGDTESTCRCGVCVNPAISVRDAANTDALLIASNGSSTPRPGSNGVYLAAHRGTASNKKKGRQRPLFLFMCERRAFPGYPHTMVPPRQMRTPRVMATNPSGLSYGVLFRTAAATRTAFRRRCFRTRRDSVAIFLGDSLTFGALVQSRMQWAVPIDINDPHQTTSNDSFHALSVYWRVALQGLSGRIPSRRAEVSEEGSWWYRRAYPIGRGGITAWEFHDYYADMVRLYLSGTRAGKVTFVSYWLGTNDLLLAGWVNASAVYGFRSAARATLSEVRRRYDGPLVMGSIPFATDPGRTSADWMAQKVWWNWAVDDINDVVRDLAREFHAGIADFASALVAWRKNLPQLDGVHPAWWAHKALAQEMLKGMAAAAEMAPRGSQAEGSDEDCHD